MYTEQRVTKELTFWLGLGYHFVAFTEEFTSVNPPIVTMSDMDTNPFDYLSLPPTITYSTQPGAASLKRGKAAQGNDKRRKQKDP
ncbi:hypothetical protein TNCV_625221 [Trichonephila clavipes]|nr:hypothetical protein TNCV_625221 [Trichonephila clavipes]